VFVAMACFPGCAAAASVTGRRLTITACGTGAGATREAARAARAGADSAYGNAAAGNSAPPRHENPSAVAAVNPTPPQTVRPCTLIADRERDRAFSRNTRHPSPVDSDRPTKVRRNKRKTQRRVQANGPVRPSGTYVHTRITNLFRSS